MIKLRKDLLVSAHMIVGIEISDYSSGLCIDVHSPDGAYWSISAEDCGMPINEATLMALAAEIDKQCREIGAAGVVSDQVKRLIEQRVDWTTHGRSSLKQGLNVNSRFLDDDIPF